ncbi:hypothetical protein BT96DRAFT_956277 [Gymnopus androsaceus JB14]|uniref:Uncharacterized protein n=1 Tax=Gymnopus androsaceus JB14 TaxID=1447944 RepID=A0A6A4HYZ0_9AGAR|nr:hypothetical protein BT96DRAFT_956277 [Gymnopus androsaceus JB14]
MSCLLFDLVIEPLAASLRKSGLKGYSEIPGVETKLIANLFADDTTVFLAEDNDFEDLEKILDRWCTASTAVFNIAKTQILPIVQDEVFRILGVWYGHGDQSSAAWTNQLEKIDKSLANWERSNPTMDRCKKIVQMVIGGMTQYLTQVQGMLKRIEKKLKKRIRQFLWAEKKLSPVNFETLLASKSEGGQEALDIEARNLAIEVMWLKSYFGVWDS